MRNITSRPTFSEAKAIETGPNFGFLSGRLSRTVGPPATCGTAAVSKRSLKGLAFEIADLLLVESWAAFHDSRMVVRVDHCAEDEEYEEVIEIHCGTSSASRLIMWRNGEAVFVQPLLGRKQEYSSVAEALEYLFPKQREVLTDIVAWTWPA
jgi:hypothetical protein